MYHGSSLPFSPPVCDPNYLWLIVYERGFQPPTTFVYMSIYVYMYVDIQYKNYTLVWDVRCTTNCYFYTYQPTVTVVALYKKESAF
jgi:hypothetical protein